MFWENFHSYEKVDSRSTVAEDANVLQYATVSLSEWFPNFHFEIHADQQVSCTAGLLQMKIKQSSAASWPTDITTQYHVPEDMNRQVLITSNIIFSQGRWGI